MKRILLAALAAVSVVSLAQDTPKEFLADRRPTLKTGGNCLIKGGRVYTITGGVLDNGDVLIQNGKITQIGRGIAAPAGVTIIDASGKFVFPGFIDAHSHRGQSDTNEGTESITGETRMKDVLDSEQIGLFHYLAGGITTAMGLHGSANAIDGESIVFKAKYLGKPADMIFEDAPRMIKFALGQNPTRGGSTTSGRFPKTRMGVEAVYRRAFEDAKAYKQMWDAYNANPSGVPPRRDLRLEVISDILQRRVWVQCHSYRQDEMLMMIRLSQEYGFKIAAMQHALEGYKIAPEMAEAGIPASLFAQNWSYKLEVMDAIPMATSLLLRAGVQASVNTDTFAGLPPLNLDAAKAMRYGITEDQALKMLTLYPAVQLGVEKRVGSLEVGKDGDICIWNGHPLSVYSRNTMTLIEGEVMFERKDPFGVDAKSPAAKSVTTTKLTADLASLPRTSRVYAITGATVHPVSGDEILNGVVLIEDGRIKDVGRSLTVPPGATVINAVGMHVYPGFIDAGSVLGLNEIGQVTASQDFAEFGQIQPDLRAITAVNPESLHIPIARSYGLTTVVVRPSGGLLPGTGSAMHLAGYTREQMGVPGSDLLVINFPESVSSAFLATNPADQIERVRRQVSDNRQMLREFFAEAKRYRDARRADPSMPIVPRFEAVMAAINGTRPVIFNANSASSIRSAVAFAREVGVTPIIAGAAEGWKVAKFLADAKVPVIYNPPGATNGDTTQGFAEFDPYDAQLVAPSILQAAGVKLALMTGSSAQAFALREEAGYLVGYGLPHREAIRALTVNAAEILGLRDLGTLEKGKIANVIITSGDPLEVTTHVEHVFIGGQPVSLKNHFTELYRKYERRLPAGR